MNKILIIICLLSITVGNVYSHGLSNGVWIGLFVDFEKRDDSTVNHIEYDGIGGILFLKSKGVFYYLFGQMKLHDVKGDKYIDMFKTDDTIAGFKGSYKVIGDEIEIQYRYISLTSI